jgi:hypothetical protein
MGLTQLQRSLVERTRSVGSAREAEPLSDADCLFLVATIARDLALQEHFPEFPRTFPGFFEVGIHERPQYSDLPFLELFDRLVSLDSNADSFFACLGALYKARLKYANILRL